MGVQVGTHPKKEMVWRIEKILKQDGVSGGVYVDLLPG